MEQYIGLPYKQNGRTREGLDCYGLLYLIEKEGFGKVIRELAGVLDGTDVSGLVEENRPTIVGEQVSTPVDGDAVLFYMQGKPVHVGVYWQDGLIHASDKRGVIYEKLSSPMLKRFTKKEYYRV